MPPSICPGTVVGPEDARTIDMTSRSGQFKRKEEEHAFNTNVV